MEPIIDSDLSLEESLADIEIPPKIRKALAVVSVRYVSFDGQVHQGQVVVHEDLVTDIREIFDELLAVQFPIERVVPIVMHDWDDIVSMRENTTSAFNYRVITEMNIISRHASGRAIDINPALNPYTMFDGSSLPEGAVYTPGIRGVITDGDAVTSAFLSRGWRWLGHRTDRPDWQHFEKPL